MPIAEHARRVAELAGSAAIQEAVEGAKQAVEGLVHQLESTITGDKPRSDGKLDTGTLHSVVPAGEDRRSPDDEAAHGASAPGDGSLTHSSDAPSVEAADPGQSDSCASASASTAACWKDAKETWADAGVTIGAKLDYWTELGLQMKRQQEAEELAAAAAALHEGPDLASLALELQRETAAEGAGAEGAGARQHKKAPWHARRRRHPDTQKLHDNLLHAACEAMARHGFEPGHLSPPALDEWSRSDQGRDRYEQLAEDVPEDVHKTPEEVALKVRVLQPTLTLTQT